MKKVDFIAFYLPQFHPIPENDQWWGEGFTEWTNVRKAKPLFKGHYQPHIPGTLGYYDLRNPEVRVKQAEMASQYGVTGFCYWHYWFGNGKRLLERPSMDMLASGEPDFPFCFAWANQTWTGIWHGLENKTLAEQQYPGYEDDVKHFYTMLPYFMDKRYIRRENKPLFVFYRPFDHPYLDGFIETWNELAIKEGLKGIYFLGISYQRKHSFKNLDGIIFHDAYLGKSSFSFFDKVVKKIIKEYPEVLVSQWKNSCHVLSYKDMIERTSNIPLMENQFPTLHVGWDNTPRSAKRGKVFHDYSPELMRLHIEKTLNLVKDRDNSFCFIKSWNEWAEGNYLEPDERFGYQKLEAFRKALSDLKINCI